MKTPYIVIDGLDACGKGTQLDLLEQRAEKENHKLMRTREPGGEPLAEGIRTLYKELGMASSPLTQFLMMWSSRSSYLDKTVRPALAAGTPVFSDRGDSSTLAYQIHAGQAPELEAEFWRMRKLVFGENEPSLYVILDVPAEVARVRSLADSTHTSAFDKKPVLWFERAREGFAAFAKALPDKVVIIDGNRPPEEVHEDFYRIVSEACGW